MESTFNPFTVTIARESRGLTQAELAGQIDVSPTLLNRLEKHDYTITAEQLSRLQQATGYPKCFFFQQGAPVQGHLAYRKRVTVAPKIISRINANINVLSWQLTSLTQRLKLKPPHLPAIPVTAAVTPEKAASKLRAAWKMNDEVPADICGLLEQHSIMVFGIDFQTDRVDSRTFFTSNGFPVICYNSRLKGDRQRFSLAFELGHLVMHTNTDLSTDRDINHEANLFAAALLMPAAAMLPSFDQGVNVATLAAMKKQWKASMIALLYRADDLGVISVNQKRYLVDQFNKLGIRRNEPPDLDIPQEVPQLIKKYLQQYQHKAGLSNKQLAEALCMNTKEFIQLHNL